MREEGRKEGRKGGREGGREGETEGGRGEVVPQQAVLLGGCCVATLKVISERHSGQRM